jgi:uncharacterized protein (DUF2267 family)
MHASTVRARAGVPARARDRAAGRLIQIRAGRPLVSHAGEGVVFARLDMSGTGLAVFDRTLQETNLWLKELMARLDTDDREQAYVILRATLHALRDRIGPENAVHLGAQLPILLRGVYYEGWRMAGTQTRERHKAEFLAHARREMPGVCASDTELAVRAVFEVLWDRVDRGEVAKLVEIFPKELRELWTGVESLT